MSEHEPGSPEWELEVCRQEYRMAWDECLKAARHHSESQRRLEKARQDLYDAAKVSIKELYWQNP